MTLFATDTGALSSIITMLLVVCAVLFVIPLIRAALHLAAPYSQSANNNAAGVSVLLDVARQVGNGLVSNEEAMERAKQEGTYVHGESAAREAGLVPEGASLEYDSQANPQESLAAAKAAIAALTGKPVADKVPVTDISSRLVKGGGLEPVDEEAISSVHFEVSETPQVRTEKPGRFRTMVSMEEENFDSDTRADEQLLLAIVWNIENLKKIKLQMLSEWKCENRIFLKVQKKYLLLHSSVLRLYRLLITVQQ